MPFGMNGENQLPYGRTWIDRERHGANTDLVDPVVRPDLALLDGARHSLTPYHAPSPV